MTKKLKKAKLWVTNKRYEIRDSKRELVCHGLSIDELLIETKKLGYEIDPTKRPVDARFKVSFGIRDLALKTEYAKLDREDHKAVDKFMKKFEGAVQNG